MDIRITTNAKPFVRELRRLRSKSLVFALRETLNQAAVVGARNLQRQYATKYDPKTARGKRMFRAPKKAGRSAVIAEASRSSVGGGLLAVGGSFVNPSGKVARPARIFNRGSDNLVRRLFRGGIKRTASGKHVVVPRTGTKRVRRSPDFVLRSERGYHIFKRSKKQQSSNYKGALVRETKRIAPRLSERKAVNAAARVVGRLWERNVRKEIARFRTRERLRAA